MRLMIMMMLMMMVLMMMIMAMLMKTMMMVMMMLLGRKLFRGGRIISRGDAFDDDDVHCTQ